jgi:hypothetical protein
MPVKTLISKLLPVFVADIPKPRNKISCIDIEEGLYWIYRDMFQLHRLFQQQLHIVEHLEH